MALGWKRISVGLGTSIVLHVAGFVTWPSLGSWWADARQNKKGPGDGERMHGTAGQLPGQMAPSEQRAAGVLVWVDATVESPAAEAKPPPAPSTPAQEQRAAIAPREEIEKRVEAVTPAPNRKAVEERAPSEREPERARVMQSVKAPQAPRIYTWPLGRIVAKLSDRDAAEQTLDAVDPLPGRSHTLTLASVSELKIPRELLPPAEGRDRQQDRQIEVKPQPATLEQMARLEPEQRETRPSTARTEVQTGRSLDSKPGGGVVLANYIRGDSMSGDDADGSGGNRDVSGFVQDRIDWVANLLSPSLIAHAGREGVAVISLEVDANGYVHSLIITHSTGSRLLDHEVETTVHLAEPFPIWEGPISFTVSFRKP